MAVVPSTTSSPRRAHGAPPRPPSAAPPGRRVARLVPATVLVLGALLASCSTSPGAAPAGTTTTARRPPAGSRGTSGPGRLTDEASTDTVTDTGTGTTLTTTAAEVAGEGTTVPVVLHAFSNGYQKPTVMVSVGGAAPVPVLLDTGSTGLHLLASAAGSTGVTTTTDAITETYADGTQYVGVRASAPVTVGGVTTASPIELMLIDTVQCASGTTCPTSSATQLIDGSGVYGTMGVSLSPSASGCAAGLYSPLLQLPGGTTGFSVGGFANGAGTIVLGNQPPVAGGTAVPLEAAAYAVPEATGCLTSGTSAQYPNGSGAWDVSTGQLCWSLAGAAPVCGRTTFDTGSEDTGLAITQLPGAPVTNGIVTTGTAVVLSAPGGGPTLWSFSAGTTPGSNRVSTSSPASYLIGTTGSAFYFSGWVTFDADGGRLVVSPG